jgi:hypothetical protein
VTLLGDLRVSGEAVERAVLSLAPSTAPLALDPQVVASSPSRFQALTVRFRPSAALDGLAAEMSRVLGLPTPNIMPHLSLAYPSEPFDTAGLLPLGGGISLSMPYLFDRLALVDPGPGRDDWEAVAAWRILRSVPLGKSASDHSVTAPRI